MEEENIVDEDIDSLSSSEDEDDKVIAIYIIYKNHLNFNQQYF